MFDHGYSLLINELEDYADHNEKLSDSFYCWTFDWGFNGTVWSCFNERLDGEGAEYKKYIKEEK